VVLEVFGVVSRIIAGLILYLKLIDCCKNNFCQIDLCRTLHVGLILVRLIQFGKLPEFYWKKKLIVVKTTFVGLICVEHYMLD
jgi:hypothetical protein